MFLDACIDDFTGYRQYAIKSHPLRRLRWRYCGCTFGRLEKCWSTFKMQAAYEVPIQPRLQKSQQDTQQDSK
ncbi:hypothetical protein GOP47_0005531 [Adiantum capillus-veneris]|uniref:Uncharacterized protein n=1 Tax=Adiantum capillus-veneris TaxID=13818 RepID=A0A9D4V6W7_ADICA|nr:hypothetical protein GOP47_0005531 [Adiantum capillus-veneris]